MWNVGHTAPREEKMPDQQELCIMLKNPYFGILGFGLTYKRQLSKVRFCFADISWDVVIYIYFTFCLIA